jgi:hypothetical protein
VATPAGLVTWMRTVSGLGGDQMKSVSDISREKWEMAFQSIRKDIGYLHRDLGYSEGHRKRWIFIIMWLVLADLLISSFNLGLVPSLGAAAAILGIFAFFDRAYIRTLALRTSKEPLEPMWDTNVDLS